LNQYKKRPGDSPLKGHKEELVAQWERRRNREGSLLETFDDEAILQVINLNEQGAELLLHTQLALTDRIRPILTDIHATIGRPFAVIGSWGAQQFARACRDIGKSVGPDLEYMVANDIDCFYGTPGIGPFVMEGVPRKETVNGHEVNWVAVRHFDVSGLLENNDINATAFAISVKEVSGSLAFEFQVSPQFWRFFLSNEHILQAVRPRQAKTRTLVRLAFKSLEMQLPFDDGAIDSRSEKLPRSQKQKLDRLNRDWPGNPLSSCTIQ